MKWISQDIEKYLKAQEFIDTAVIPLVPIAFRTEMKQAASMAEFITLISTLMERQFTGRILLFPPFTYLKEGSNEQRYSQLVEWVSAINENQFKQLFFLTCDSDWKVYEEQLKDSLIWIPAIPFENLEDSQKFSIVESQVQQILAIFSRKWQEIE